MKEGWMNDYCRKWYTHDFLAESQKLLKKAPTRKDACITPPAEGMSNISKYSGHLLDFTCYDGNPRTSALKCASAPSCWNHILALMLAGLLCSRTLYSYIQLAPCS
ncbi:uncharacterized protein TNCV_290511 [Trichonephila clavipes]|nr:uncharacterized protein TNCV_290511 [Trichonephila clavipes]